MQYIVYWNIRKFQLRSYDRLSSTVVNITINGIARILNSLKTTTIFYKTIYKKNNSSRQHRYLYLHFKYQLSIIYTPFNAILLSSHIYYNHSRAKFIQLSLYTFLHPLVSNKVSYQPVQPSSPSPISSSNTHHDISNRGTIVFPPRPIPLLTLFPPPWKSFPPFLIAHRYIRSDSCNLFPSFARRTKRNSFRDNRTLKIVDSRLVCPDSSVSNSRGFWTF